MISHNWSPMKRLIWLRGSGAVGGAGSWETISGNPVSFTAKAAPLRQLKVAFSPVQDLHGYDAPWPAGGGANKWDEEWEAGIYSSDNGLPQPSTQNIMGKNRIPVQPSTQYYAYINTPNASLKILYYDANDTYLSNEIKARQTFTTPANAAFVRFSTVNFGGTTYNNDIAINYPSSVTTYSPYSNICPISGWDSLNVEQRGKNLADLSDLEFDDSNYSHSLNVVNYPKLQAFVNDIASLAGQTVYYAVETTGTSQSGQQKIGAFRFVYGGTNVQAFYPNEAHTITAFDPSTVTAIIIYGNSNGASVKNLMVSLGSSAPSDFVPYNPSSRSISISLGSTVYSGTVDVVTGVGEITHKSIVIDENTILSPYTTGSGKTSYSAYVGDDKYVNALPIICDYYKTVTRAQIETTDYNAVGLSNNHRLYFIVDFATKELFSAWLETHNVTVVYELETPIPIQLTPQEVNSLAGDNTMWADANGDLTVEYRSN